MKVKIQEAAVDSNIFHLYWILQRLGVFLEVTSFSRGELLILTLILTSVRQMFLQRAIKSLCAPGSVLYYS